MRNSGKSFKTIQSDNFSDTRPVKCYFSGFMGILLPKLRQMLLKMTFSLLDVFYPKNQKGPKFQSIYK